MCCPGTHSACHAHGWPEASLKLARDAGHGLIPSYDCKAFGAPPDVEPAISFTAQPPAPGQHPSQFVGFLDVAAGGRTYEVSIRSTSGAASRSYTLVQPSTPLAFAATGPACLCVTLARSASLQRSNSNSSMGTVG